MEPFVQRADRFRVNVPISYRASGDEEWLLSRVVNFSESGILFGPTELGLGDDVELIITSSLPVGSRPPGTHVCAGKVVRTTEIGTVAVRFETWRVLLEA